MSPMQEYFDIPFGIRGFKDQSHKSVQDIRITSVPFKSVSPSNLRLSYVSKDLVKENT